MDCSEPASDFVPLDPRVAYFVRGAPRQNFGDYLPELLADSLLAYPKVDADVFRLIGSVIEERWIRRDLMRANGWLTGRIAFWGCGMRKAEPLSPKVMQHCLFFGVRGPATRDALGLPEDTVLGDPGLLVPLAHSPKPHPRTLGKAICIPHVEDRRPDEELLALSGAEVLVRPEIPTGAAPLRDLLDQIASASFVHSASLHGAIVAAAYGRPMAFWDNGHLDTPFKWTDFASSAGIAAEFAPTVAEGQRIARSQASELRLPRWLPILLTAPFTLRPQALLRGLTHEFGDSQMTIAEAQGWLTDRDQEERQELARHLALSVDQRALRDDVVGSVSRQLNRSARAFKKRLQKTG